MVAKFVQPDSTTQTGTAYKGNIDAAIAVLAEQAAQFAVAAQDAPNLTVAMRAGRLYLADRTIVSVAAQNSAALTAPATNPRNDIVYYDASTGAIGVAAGAEAASPADPTIPANKIPKARIRWTVGMASITNSVIDDLSPAIFTSALGLTGEMRMYGGGAAPVGWLLCNGAAVSRATYASLFNVIGTTFGTGDGSTTFNLPDLSGRAPIGAGQGAGLTNRVLGTKVGAETHTLTQAETPLKTHTHGVTDAGHAHAMNEFNDLAGGTGSGRISGTTNIGTVSTTSVTTGVTINGAGDTAATGHNNMQPVLVVNFIIKT